MKVSRKQVSFGLIVVVVIILLFFLHYIKVLRPVENLVVRAFRPVQQQAYKLSGTIGGWYQDIKTKEELEAEIKDLQQQLNQRLLDQAQSQMLVEENEFLRQQLNFASTIEYQAIISKVISKSTEEISNTIVIDQGRKAGIVEGAPVVVAQNIIIGKVIKADDYSSVVLLLNDHSSQIAGSVLNQDKTIGVVKGEYGLGIKMELIPQTENVQEGEVVITSGIEEHIPRGLVVGTIDNVSGAEEELFKQAVIRLPVDFNKIFIVSVLIPQINVDSDN